ncbi:hypothetical protein ZYGR_0S01940 [Zygosaccharomyces rouxii]|uniref:GrpE protein homolog n=2 Tax=Zygosaccharomyces rouxii TaxID=4956 RepID=C5DXQ0_ZYGRC|nr:uncharacterized protein ZYRO0F06820g [Zygosaccharomyces rouxii]KAH9199320.1 GrpE-domain-containing protein [Zygosaccharomyces rouxii]GAV50060.1 hypothetical protein ZYGR_0S01940 [Zygosaccharomyces rouxii]CAR28561.1 ZYRO0F06820p [Zygosaccharomyces rouxii]
MIRALSYMVPRTGALPVRPVYRSVANARFYSQAKNENAQEEPKQEQENKKEEQGSELQELQQKLQNKDKEAAEYKDRLVRCVADFRNLQEVTKKDVQKAKDFALQKFAKDLLESVDNFGHALNAFDAADSKHSSEVKELYTGVKMTRDVFEKTLYKYGIEKIEPLGQQFDPNQHEATFELDQPDKEPGTVFFVQQVGFSLNSRVIRPAKVGIVKARE